MIIYTNKLWYTWVVYEQKLLSSKFLRSHYYHREAKANIFVINLYFFSSNLSHKFVNQSTLRKEK